MDIIFDYHFMINDRRSMNCCLVSYLNSSDTSNMSIYSVKITNLSIMPYHCVRLNHVVTTYATISSQRGKSTYHITFAHANI